LTEGCGGRNADVATKAIPPGERNLQNEIGLCIEPSKTPGAPFPEDLLHELLTTFGLDEVAEDGSPMTPNRHSNPAEVPDDLVRRAAGGPPPDPAEWGKLAHREVEEAGTVLALLVKRVRDLKRYPLPQPDEYRRRRADVIASWNGAIYERAWKTLPPLCDSCGRPVLLRQPERVGGGNVDPSTVCSERCRNRRKALGAKKKKRPNR
jgi:hypothetical protein